MHRRHFLGAAPAAVWAVSALPASAAQTGAAEVTPLGERLWLLAGLGGNVVVFQSSDGVLLVDGGAAAHTTQLLREVERLTGTQRIHTLVNTHWHHEHTGANATLGKAGTRIVAHEYTRLWLTTDVEDRIEGRVYQPLPKIAWPTQTFHEQQVIEFGGERIECGHLGQAHTDGDIYVRFRNANVLVAGDAVAVGRFPLPDPASNGWVGGLATASATLVKQADEQTRVVTGAGTPQGLAHLKAQQAMLDTMRQRLAQLLAQGLSASEMIAAKPATQFEAEWGDPAAFIRHAYPGLAHRSRELGVSIV